MKNKITIGLFIDTFFPMIDGVTMVVHNYAKRLVKYADVIVFAPNYPGKDFDDSIFPYKVVRCKSLKAPIIDYGLPIPELDGKFKKALSKSNLDIVHIHSPFMVGKSGIKYAKKHNIPVIATMHSQFKKDLKRAVKNDKIATILNNTIIKTFNKCDECWAVNSEVARIFFEDYGYKTMPRVMNNSTDMEELQNKEEACERINKLHNIKSEEKLFLFVGRINSLKNIFFLAESLKILKETSDLNYKMLFVGSGQDEEELKKWITKNNMEDRIILCGRVSDRELLASYYARADLFLFPSLYDASSIVQIEAASQHTPTLFLKEAATTATVTNNVNGFLEENDVNKYAKRIEEIMNNQELYKKVCEKAFEDLYKNWDDTISEVYDLYIKLINEASN